MDSSRLELRPKLWLDSRRAVFLEEERTLAVADLHLGYAWAHRFHGQMMPLLAQDAAAERLADLCAFYRPASLVLLGDVVHAAVPVAEVAGECRSLVRELSQHCSVRFIAGNHDRNLKRIELDGTPIVSAIECGPYLLLHGDRAARKRGEAFIVMGHEHPAISLGDGIRSAKFPCFLAAENLLILPAFSNWAAGSDIRCGSLMSPLARAASFRKAIAICGPRLLAVPLQ